METWRAMVELKNKGVVRDIGVSNYLKRHIKHLLENSEVVPAVNQI